MVRDLSSLFPFRLEVTGETIHALQQLRLMDKFADLPGTDTGAEKVRCTAKINELIDRLIAGLKENPRKTWVLEQFIPTLRSSCDEDTEARERFGPYLEAVMDAVGMDSSDGLLNCYLAFGGDSAQLE